MKVNINEIIKKVVQQLKAETYIIDDKLILECLRTAHVTQIGEDLTVIIDLSLINKGSCICKGFYQPATCPIHGKKR